jgi:surface polysaccharide O-acyltransferase-like enzyme
MINRPTVQSSTSDSSGAGASAARGILGQAFATALAWLRGDACVLTDRDISRTISFARISLVVGLVFLHYGSYPNSRISPFRGIDVNEHQLATGINSFVLFSFFSVVPLLSMISGWLFFSFADADARTALTARIRKRFTSLYLPLVFWNLAFLAAMLVLYAASPSYPLLDELNINFAKAPKRAYVNAIFAITQHPIGFQFWFVRDLFVTALVSPILWFFLRRAPWVAVAVLGTCWLAEIDTVIFFRPDVVLFFFLGGLVRRHRAALHVSRNATVVFCALYVGLITLRTLAPYAIDLSNEWNHYLLDVATRATRVVGVVACWGVFQRIALTDAGEIIGRFGSFAFFLHAAHYPLLAEVKILLWRLLPAETDGWMLAHYATSVVVTVVIGVSAGLFVARQFPRVFALMNGGRAAIG